MKSRRPACESAFTVTELLVAVSLMSLIVLALYAMFNQTQKALRSNEAQVDSSERGRALLELVSRELEGARVSGRSEITNLWTRLAASSRFVQGDTEPQIDAVGKSNRFDYVYFLTKNEKAWRGVGFTVLQATNVGGREVLGPAVNELGQLYRYETVPDRRDFGIPTTNLFAGFVNVLPWAFSQPQQWPQSTNFSQVADGIVHFKIIPYDTQGRILGFGTTNLDSTYQMMRTTISGLPLPFPASNFGQGNRALVPAANVILQQTYFNDINETIATFRSNALPAYLELELGVLEPDAMRQYNQMLEDGLPNQAKRFMEKRLASVQVFRKRIPFRTVVQ